MAVTDYRTLFTSRRHADLVVLVDGTSFNLHSFPLVAASGFFDDVLARSGPPRLVSLDATGASAATATAHAEVELTAFPGGAAAFEVLARYCYGFDVPINVKNICHIFCGSKVLRMASLAERAEEFLESKVLHDVSIAAKVLHDATHLKYASEDMMVELVGRCMNAVAAGLTHAIDLVGLPPECVACVLRNALEFGRPRHVVQASMIKYCREAQSSLSLPQLTMEQVQELMAAPGSVDGVEYAGLLCDLARLVLGRLGSPEDITRLCDHLHVLGMWTQLPHDAIEAITTDGRIPAKYCTIALLEENRRLLREVTVLRKLQLKSQQAARPSGTTNSTSR